MGHSITLGGDRVGSGNKNKVYLHNYERSTHNLSEKFSSTMGVGMLIPFMCKLATRDDKFEIDLSAGLRTIPTKAPLFGSFKLQLDVYQCPLRLYQALLHNNPLAIGLKANQVKFPKMRLFASSSVGAPIEGQIEQYEAGVNSLVRYLGVSGLGSGEKSTTANANEYSRDFFGAGVLAYYDIFKNYYANKQEENAYTCKEGSEKSEITKATEIKCTIDNNNPTGVTLYNYTDQNVKKGWSVNYANTSTNPYDLNIEVKYKKKGSIYSEYEKGIKLFVEYEKYEPAYDATNLLKYYGTLEELYELGIVDNATPLYDASTDEMSITINLVGEWTDGTANTEWRIKTIDIYKDVQLYEKGVVLQPFKLSNIDDMRMEILSFHQLGQSFVLDGTDGGSTAGKFPYLAAIGSDYANRAEQSNWMKPLAGLCVKTYQSDIFNNWINTEWIDGENGIAAITAISTSDGKITIDALNFSEKLYNLLNRIAVSGATYEDYLDAAYTDSAKKFCEAPMWIGGMSDEIVFEEIVQTSAGDDGNPLGTLAGKGNLLGKHKGGKITCKIDEPSLIIGIVSITPRINYTQGNEWYNTEIDSLMDIHVPALDGIAFQNLLGERLHFGSTILTANGGYEDRPIVGKIPAWLEYMTSYDRAFGDFAAKDGDAYMILQRDYLCEDGELKDATTYIDPAKYNYAFAYTKRDAQNFWVQIHSNIKARRLMSAKQIPSV